MKVSPEAYTHSTATIREVLAVFIVNSGLPGIWLS